MWRSKFETFVFIRSYFSKNIMLIYLETSAKPYPQTKKILSKFSHATIIEIDNYKNIFDKHTAGMKEQKSLIIAKLCSPALTPAPVWYGHSKDAFFFKTSLGCIYDCDYCFLKGAFQTEHMVFFVNYDDIKKQIQKAITSLNEKYSTNTKHQQLWFYSSDYSDIQWMDGISGFNEEFIGFFENFQWVSMEIRTKSWNIQSLLDIWYAPKNTEIAFSLNPQKLIEKYEKKTASLDMRLKAINTLTHAGWRVGIRLLPLLPVKNYQKIYREFFYELHEKIDISKLSSSFASGLLFTKRDYKVMLKKYPHLDILHYLSLEDDDFYRESREVRDWFYQETKKLDKNCLLCLEG